MNQRLKLAERLIKFRIDHYVVVFPVMAHFSRGLSKTRRNLLRGLPATVGEALGKTLYRRWQDVHADYPGKPSTDLAGALPVDIKEHALVDFDRLLYRMS